MQQKLCECGCGTPTKLSPSDNKFYGWVKGSPRRFIHGHACRGSFDIRVRILERMRENLTSECWEWTGTKDGNGYGVLVFEGRKQKAHRVSYKAFSGKDASHLSVCHSCDNPCCVNPNHLWLGTHQDNVSDCSEKFRMHPGEEHGMSKLKEEDVRYIRNSSKSGVDLARMFNVKPSCISSIRRGVTWRHLLQD